MGEGLSIGKTWTVNVPADSTRTVSPNLWQYSLFPMGTTPTIMYPSDGLSNFNDSQLMNFDYNVSSLMDTSANMFYQIMPMMKQWMAQQAEMYQKIMASLHSNTNVTVTNPANNDNTEIDGTKVIKENQIEKVITEISTDPNNSGRFNKEITITNKDGKEEKTTLLRRLIDLSKQYQDDPTTAEISDGNYKLLWDIAGKYAKTGELSTSEYKTLLEIAKNPGGPGAYKEEETDEEDGKENVRPGKYQAAIDNTEAMDYYKKLSNEYKNLLYESDATEESLSELTKHTNKYNVLYLVKDFEKYHGSIEEENLIDAIFDDTSRWGKIKYGFITNATTDDAKPSVTHLSNALIERANDLIKNNAEFTKQFVDEEKKTTIADVLKAKISALQNALNTSDYATISWSGKKLSDDAEKAISNTFKDLADTLFKYETEAYGEVEI